MSDTSKEAVDLTPKPLLTISAHETTLYHILYLPGGRRLVTSSRDCTVRTWNVENGEEEGMRMEHGYRVWGLAVTRDGKRILSSGRDELLRVWDAETHQPIAEWAHKADIICIASSPDDQLVASGDVEGRVVIREMKEGGRIKHSIETSAGDVLSICFSPDGTKLASGHEDNNIRVFDVENGNLILGPIEGHTDDVNSVVWSLDGKYLFTASSDQAIRSWDCESGETIGEPWIGHTDRVITISLSPDGTKLASASLDGTVRFWAPDSGDPIGEPLEHEWEANAVAFSPSGEFVACGGRSGKLSIWRVPWWDDSKGQAHNSLLDLPAVTVPRHTATDIYRQPDYLDLPTNHRHARLHSSHATESPSRMRSSIFSSRAWRALLFGRSHDPPRPAKLTTVYPSPAADRIYVASRDGESTNETPTEPMPTAPGHYRRFSILAESVSSTDSLNQNQPTPAAPVNSEHAQVSCCGLSCHRRARSGIPPVPPAVPLCQRTTPTSIPPAPPVAAPSHPNVLDLPAVVEPLSDGQA